MDLNGVRPIPIQWFRVCKLLILKTFIFVCNSFVTLEKSLFTTTYPRYHFWKKTVLKVHTVRLNGNWYGLGEIMDICVVWVRLVLI